MISRETIDNIISAVRIEEVIGDFISLRRRGVNLIGLCPFHNEKTPSFTVSQAKGIYKCFGCGKAGNGIGFIMEHEHLTYPEALRYLAKKYQIEIEEEEQTPEQIQEISEKESQFNLNEFARKYFSSVLFDTEEGKAVGLAYFGERDIREDIIKKFQLGFSPDQWNAFSEHAIMEGYKKDILQKTGLSIEKDGRLYDRFHSRVIFPIHSASGRIIGFGGRILTSDKSHAKYINSPESDIYNKSKTLYGIYFARTAIAQKDNCYLVEGYTDVISLHQAGIENVVASSGTSLTADQVRMIQRYTSNITILYDGDPAGIKASFRGIDMVLEQGMNVKIVLFPDNEDPDSYARKHHPSETEKFITTNAVNFISFKTKLLFDETKNDPIKKAGLIKDIVASISLIPDAITRTLFIRECADMMTVPEQVLVNELNKIRRNRLNKELQGQGGADDIPVPDMIAPHQFVIEADNSSAENQEKEVMRLLLLYGTDVVKIDQPDENNDIVKVPVIVADYMVHDICRDDLEFDNKVYAAIFEEYRAGLDSDQIPERSFFLGHEEKEIAYAAVDLIFTPYELSQNWLKHNVMIDMEEEKLLVRLDYSLLSFKARKIDLMIGELQKKLHGNDSAEDVKVIQMRFKDLKAKSVQIHGKLNRIVIR
ncbi:MAG: DNA primase [Bacteroidetes bacterium]|nr:DNA primase [Bacteroidota bacterium]